MKLRIHIDGHQLPDLIAALDRVLDGVREGVRSGAEIGDTCASSFEITGDPVACYALGRIDLSPTSVLGKCFGSYEDAKAALGSGEYVVALDAEGRILYSPLLAPNNP